MDYYETLHEEEFSVELDLEIGEILRCWHKTLFVDAATDLK